ncbi:holliday junction resolvase [Rhodococcus phage Mbo2]|uniref:Holliday junction resolvase n=1 Tax=Rhodococcus phage Mbo2 TaxID=2936911 RepID=A0A9E7L9X2_9CAUD|nr:holliday junction resolvase [Rhodococcus phage Mbo2]
MIIKDAFILNVNPESWKVPPFSVGRRGGGYFPVAGQDQGNAAYKEAVRESLLADGAEMREPPYHLHLIFWRQLDTYTTAKGSDHTKHWSDSTNMQKLTEDACQGVIINDDKHVRLVTSQIVEQDTDTQPTVVVLLKSGIDPTPIWLPEGFEYVRPYITEARQEFAAPKKGFDNSWPPK